jgi:hypothetical protein
MSEELIIVIAWEQLHKALIGFRRKIGCNVPITQINFDNIVTEANKGLEKECPGCAIEQLDFQGYLKHGAIKVKNMGTDEQLGPECVIIG